LPVDALSGIDQAIEATKNNNTLTVQLALDYGGHNEIDRAIQKAVAAGEKEFSESTLSKYFDNPFVPSPDYICRSAGEKRLSGFMLYQSNYAELGFYDKLWPDWDESMVNLIVDDFHKRIRKFGEVK
jgi:undecaprenyl diphosphate synthase